MKRLLFAFITLTALVSSALAQSYDNSSVIVIYTENQTLAQNLASLNQFIDENIEPQLEYEVTAESDPFFDFLFGYRMVRFRAFANGSETLIMPDDYRLLDGLQPFWAQEIPLNITQVFTNDFGSFDQDDFDVAAMNLVQNQTTVGTILLGRAAPAGGLTVTIRASNGAVKVPTSVRIPAGQRRATFTVKANRVTRTTAVTVTVRVRGVNYTDQVAVRPR
ncbi:MAG: hypothetical protein K1X67_23070 [Fimbriimonadaceae bacterium]|nr:hypothetical protein [Fimbriimonadaceae bacterium]